MAEKVSYVLILIFALVCSGVDVDIDYESICLHTEWWGSPVCLPDSSGYIRVYCSSFMDWNKGEWVWNPNKPKNVTKCKYGCFLELSTAFNGFSRAFKYFQELSKDFKNFQGLSKDLKNF